MVFVRSITACLGSNSIVRMRAIRSASKQFGVHSRWSNNFVKRCARKPPIILTENDPHEIIDIRGYTPGPEGPPLPFPKPGPPTAGSLALAMVHPDLVLVLVAVVVVPLISARKAQEVVRCHERTSCNPLTVPPPCIPFFYPDDGCWGPRP